MIKFDPTDGVAVVIYKTMSTFAGMDHHGHPIDGVQIFLGFLSFFTIAFGGLVIGIFMGVLTSLITKTTNEVRGNYDAIIPLHLFKAPCITVVEPLAVFGMAYLAFAAAEVFHFSGIISIIGCGLIQAHYAFKNISKKSYTTVKYFIKMLSSTSDCIIFLFLGIAVVHGPHYWHTGFTLWTVSFCLVCRFIGVYLLIWLANRKRIREINLQEQFITAYGGLRGAVGFSLVEMINSDNVPPKTMFVTTTLAMVMFTIFFQGGTIKFLVNLLDIDKKKDKRPSIYEEINESLMDQVVAGVELISGQRGRHYVHVSL